MVDSNSNWERISLLMRTRYARLIRYSVRRALQWNPDLTEEDCLQEVEHALWTACRTWDTRRALDMQFSSYLHWHLQKRLGRLRSRKEALSQPFNVSLSDAPPSVNALDVGI